MYRVGFGIAANGVAFIEGKFGLKLPSKAGVGVLAYKFIEGVTKGELDRFFSIKQEVNT